MNQLKLISLSKQLLLLLFFSSMVQSLLATSAFAQDGEMISIDLKNVALVKVFNLIEQQSDYKFSFNENEIAPLRLPRISFKKEKIKTVLTYIEAQTNVQFKVVNKLIGVKVTSEAKKPAPKLTSQTVPAENLPDVNIKGKVIDAADGSPLIGATIQAKGSDAGTVSDVEGNFALNVPAEVKSLVVSYVGYRTLEIPIGNQTNFSIQLSTDATSMNEVVVVGYGTAKKKDLTGALSSVSGEKITEIASTNLVQALQGRAAGVTIQTQSWKPGTLPQIRLRGNRSINASNEPLYVIDGLPIVDGISEISPNDIESIDILKDASATAIYGARGANGVILIKTKQGREGKTQVEVNSYYGIQENLPLPKLMNAAEFVEFSREAQRNSLGGAYSTVPNKELDFKNEQLIATPYMSANMQKAWESGTYDPSKLSSTDWLSYGLRSGAIQDHQMSIRGGNEKTKFMVSGTYFNNLGVVKDQDYTRYSGRINFEHQVNKLLKIGVQSQYSNSRQNAGWSDIFDVYGLKSFNPLASPYEEDGVLALYPTNNTRTPNPITNFGNTIRLVKQTRSLNNYFVELNLLEGLSIKSSLGLDLRNQQNLSFDAKNTASAGGIAPSNAANATSKRNMYSLENILNYRRLLGKVHSFNLTLAQSIQNETAESASVSVKDLPYDSQLFYNVGSALTINGVNSNFSKWRYASFLGRINYSFGDKYLATVSARYDGSSRLAEGRKWVMFPAVALAWRLKNEEFLKDVALINDLKLRVGWGKTGNSAIDPYKTWGSLSTIKYIFGDAPVLGFTPLEIINPTLTWETTEQYNLGLDFALLRSRITGSIEMYSQNTYDLLLKRQLPTVSGFTEILTNIGKTRNRGLELTLNTTNVSTPNLEWRTDWIFATNREQIVELYNGSQSDVGNNWFIDQPVNVVYDLGFNGIWQNTPQDLAEMAKFNANGATFKPGDVRPLDYNGDYKITADDRYIIGQINPKWTASLGNTFRYKRFDASVFIYGMFGQTIANDLDLRFDGRYNQPNLNYWTPENPSNEFPRPLLGTAGLNYLSTLNYFDGSFVRIKNISLGYTLPSEASKKVGMGRLRMYASVQNPVVFTKFPGTDPEGATGFDEPSVISYLFGLNLQF